MDYTQNNKTHNRQLNTEQVIVGGTTYIVRSNADVVPADFVKKTVLKMLFDDLKQKSKK